MKIFISWSGSLSNSVAIALRDFVKIIFNQCDPFVSSEDIDKGTRGLEEIAAQLDATTVGIFCVTAENLERPWINYEAGAISKEVGKGRVMPLLVDLERSDIPQHSPLTQFQMTLRTKEDISRLFHSINRAQTPHLIDESLVDKYFEAFWNEFDQKVSDALKSEQNKIDHPSVTPGAMIGEILDLVRSQQREISSLRITVERILSRQNRYDGPVTSAGRLGLMAEMAETIVNLEAELGHSPTLPELASAMKISPTRLRRMISELASIRETPSRESRDSEESLRTTAMAAGLWKALEGATTEVPVDLTGEGVQLE